MTLAIIQEQTLTDIADAIREKNGLTDTYTPAEMPQAISDIPTAAGELDGIIDGTLTVFSMPADMYYIAPYRFYNFTQLSNVDLTRCTEVGQSAFYGCTNIGTVKMPSLLTVGTGAFQGCTSLSVDGGALPASLDNIGTYAFAQAGTSGSGFALAPASLLNIQSYAFQASKLLSISGPIGFVGANACQNCTSLTSVDVSSMGNVAADAFNGCTALQTLRAPIVGSIASNSFKGLTGVTTLDLSGSQISSLSTYAFAAIGASRANASSNPFVLDFSGSTFTQVPSYAFGGNSSSVKTQYMTVILPDTVTSIQSYAFQYSDHVDVYLKGTTAPSLAASNVWNGATNYNIFVPYNAAHAYSTGTNWTAQASHIHGYSEANAFTAGQTLPAINVEGYALTWYRDSALTTPVTTVSDASVQYYCSVGTTQVGYGITRVLADDCTVQITDGTNNYSVGEGVPANTVLTITGIPTTAGWTPYIFTVNGNNFTSGDTFTMTTNLEIVAIYWDGVNVPVNPTLSQNSWVIIRDVCRQGKAKDYWSIGDTIDITLTNNQTITYRLSDGKSGRYALSDGTGNSEVVFEPLTQLSNITRSMNSNGSNVGGYASSQMHTYLNSTVYDMFPADVKAAMSQVKILSGTGGGTSSGTSSSDNYVFLMAETEMGARTYSIGTDESPLGRYEYYEANTAASARIKQRDGTNREYWLRSPQSGYSYSFVYVNSNGSFYYGDAGTARGVAPCFAI